MPEVLSPEELQALEEKVGGRFKLTTAIQRRLRELCKGAQPLVEVETENLIDIALAEIHAGKVSVKGDPPQRRRRR